MCFLVHQFRKHFGFAFYSLFFARALIYPSLFPQLVFNFCDKMFGVMIKDVEAMDASILKGEPASGKKQKVADHMPSYPDILLELKKRAWGAQ